MLNMKTDYLKECMGDITSAIKRSVSIDDFNREFCSVCMSKECSRSGNNNLLITLRAKNWESDLFLNVPRASDQDSRYDAIRDKWVEKMVLESQAPAPKAPPQEPPPQAPAPQEPPLEEALSPVIEEPEPLDDVLQNETKVLMYEEVVSAPETGLESETAVIPDPAPTIELPVAPPPPKPVPPSPQKNYNTPFNKPGYLGEAKEEIIIESGGSFTFG